jgi:hypothetical protein
MPTAWKIHKQVWTPPGRRTLYFGSPVDPIKKTFKDSELFCEKRFDWSINPVLVSYEDGTWAVMPETAMLILILNDQYRLKR